MDLVSRNLQVEATGVATSVPNNSIAKLMYYLTCLNHCLGDFLPERLTDYQHYSQTSEEEKTIVAVTAVLLSPDEVLNKVMFLVETGSPTLRGKSCEFYNFTEAQRVLSAIPVGNGVIVVDGKSVNVSRIMVCQESWLLNYYIQPIRQEEARLKQIVSAMTGENVPAAVPARKPAQPSAPPASSLESGMRNVRAWRIGDWIWIWIGFSGGFLRLTQYMQLRRWLAGWMWWYPPPPPPHRPCKDTGCATSYATGVDSFSGFFFVWD